MAPQPDVKRRDDWNGEGDPLFTVAWPADDVSIDVQAPDAQAAVALAVDALAAAAAQAAVAATTDAQRTTAGTIRDLLAQRVVQLEGAAKGWAGLTAAQKDAAMRSAVRGVALLARLQLRQLDATGD